MAGLSTLQTVNYHNGVLALLAASCPNELLGKLHWVHARLSGR